MVALCCGEYSPQCNPRPLRLGRSIHDGRNNREKVFNSPEATIAYLTLVAALILSMISDALWRSTAFGHWEPSLKSDPPQSQHGNKSSDSLPITAQKRFFAKAG